MHALHALQEASGAAVKKRPSAARKSPAKATAKLKPKASKKAKSPRKPKPALWLKLKPNGCGKCRYSPGCTRSCWLYSTGKIPGGKT
jgi:hypothetical protein